MELITITVVVITWMILSFIPSFEDEFENVISPNQIESGRSILHSIFTFPLLAIGLMFLLKQFFGDGGIIFIFSMHLLLILLTIVSNIYWWNQYKAAKKESLIKAKQFFKQFPWEQVKHAYGIATDSPEYLFTLIKENEEFTDAREDAVYDFLYARPWHQSDVYSSTPYAIYCVQYIIENVDISRLKIGDNPLLFDLFHFICLCLHGAQSDEKLRTSITEGKELYKSFQNHPNPKVQEEALELVTFCKSNG